MPSYAFRTLAGDLFLSAPEFAMPIPVHAQIAQAIRAEEAARAPRVNVDAILEKLVTDHGTPPMYRGGIPANARKLVALAESAGFETRVGEGRIGCRVEGYNAGRALGFTATWERGRAKGATWHTPWRYGLVEDRRPFGVDARTKLSKAGHRHPRGASDTRLAILGSPWGLAITHSELTSRLQEIIDPGTGASTLATRGRMRP